MILDNIKIYASDKKNSYSNIAKKIIEIINETKAFHISVSELAKRVGCSQPTVTRFINIVSNKEGYRIFSIKINKEIKLYFEGELVNGDYVEDQNSIVEDIKNTFAGITKENIEGIVETIKGANKINVVSIGGNNSIKFEIEHTLAKIGKFVMIGYDWHQQLINIKYMQENDIVIAISYSGSKGEIISIINEAKRKNIKIILITGYFESESKKLADYVLNVYSKDAKFRAFSYSSRVCALALWNVIFKYLLMKEELSQDIIEAWQWKK
ncbi:MurR/RpiR family transcriptional regulator [Spiroplasma endosymbiont of Crioceris asparagi]|uniref:MurR/RpiR family transcriptional regulator n=1 Tax=Spiroplasma endosymbiont of Crioceris asparagi TaxID=3066286 RepID=UPI0030D02F95